MAIPRARSAAAVVLAALVPLAVLAASWSWFERPAEPTGKAAAMERTLRRLGRADVVVLGSSLARTNVRPDVLAEELGIGSRNVAVLTLPNATAAHWYAIMKNRVFANGHRPRAVLIVGALTTMITPEVLKDSNVERLVNQLSDDEPVIGRKVFHTEDPAAFRWLYMREQAGQLRDDLLETWRDLALSLTFRRSGKLDAGARLATRANEIVFADERMDYELHNLDATGLWVGAVDAIDLEGVDIARDSLLTDIAALATEHGARAVFVRTPFPPSNVGNDQIPRSAEREAADVMRGAGAVYIDLRSLNLEDRYFRDMRHMSRDGAAIFTRALARTLRETGALRGEASSGGPLHLRPASITRSASSPTHVRVDGTDAVSSCAWRLDVPDLTALRTEQLARIGHPTVTPVRATLDDVALPWRSPEELERCLPGVGWVDGALVAAGPRADEVQLSLEAAPQFIAEGEQLPSWWVYPGTTLTITFDTAWPYPDEAFDVFLLGHILGGTIDGLKVRVDGSDVPVDVADLRVWATGRPRAPKDERWTVEVVSASDGPWVLVQNLRVGRAPYTSDVIGRPEALAGASIRIVGGKVEDTQLSPVYLAPPPEVQLPGKVRDAPRGVGMFAMPRYRDLADAPNSRSPNPHRCSPFRVSEDGKVMPEPHVTCLDMANLKGGRSCHAGDVLFFTASDGSDPTTNGRSYAVSLDPTRVCDRLNQQETTPLRGSLWLYPGDHVVLDFPDDKLETFLDGANRLEYALDPVLADEDDAVLLRFSVGGEVVLEERVTASSRRRVYRRHELEPALAPRAHGVTLELVNEGGKAWWLLVMATLSEDYPHAAIVDALREGAVDVVRSLPEVTGERPPDRLERVGPVPELPAPKSVEVVRKGLSEANLFPLWPISNSVLAKEGYGWWTPVRLREGSRVLQPALTRGAFGDGSCDCFLHLGKSLVARLDDPTGAALVPFLAPELPTPVADGEVVWVYPGGGARIGFDAPWEGDEARLVATVAALSTDRNSGWAPPVLRVGDVARTFEHLSGDRWVVEAPLGRAEPGPWHVLVTSPEAGPYLLLLDLTLVDGAGAQRVVAVPSSSGGEADDDDDDDDEEVAP